MKNIHFSKKKILKLISNDSILINLCIKINFKLSEIGFMNSLIININDNLTNYCSLSTDILRIKVYFKKKEEIGNYTMEIELFKYKNEEGKYLLDFLRTEGEISDYNYYFLEIKILIQEMIKINKLFYFNIIIFKNN